jgi:hypothetical protein
VQRLVGYERSGRYQRPGGHAGGHADKPGRGHATALWDRTGSLRDADILISCKWEKDDPTGITVGLHFLALPEGVKCAVDRAGSSPVDGLGVPASWDFIAAGVTGSLVACPSGWQVQITTVGDILGHTTAEDTLKAAAVQLMGLVLKRM